MEGGTAKTCRRDRSPDHRVPLSSRNQQVDQDRASPVLVHQSELARSTAAESRSCRQSDRQHENEAGTQGASQVRHQPISLWSQGDRGGTGGGLAQTGEVSRRMELQHPSQCAIMEHLFWHKRFNWTLAAHRFTACPSDFRQTEETAKEFSALEA